MVLHNKKLHFWQMPKKSNSGQLTKNVNFWPQLTRNASPKLPSVYFLSLETTFCVSFTRITFLNLEKDILGL